ALPKTVSEFEAFCNRISDLKNGEAVGASIETGLTAAWRLQAWTSMFGGLLFSTDSAGKNIAALDNKPAKDYLKWVKDLVDTKRYHYEKDGVRYIYEKHVDSEENRIYIVKGEGSRTAYYPAFDLDPKDPEIMEYIDNLDNSEKYYSKPAKVYTEFSLEQKDRDIETGYVGIGNASQTSLSNAFMSKDPSVEVGMPIPDGKFFTEYEELNDGKVKIPGGTVINSNNIVEVVEYKPYSRGYQYSRPPAPVKGTGLVRFTDGVTVPADSVIKVKGYRIRAYILTTSYYGLNHECAKDSTLLDAAARYLLYTVSYESQKVLTDKMVSLGKGLFQHPRFLRKFGYDNLAKRQPEEWGVMFEKLNRYGVAGMMIPETRGLLSYIKSMYESVLLSNTPIEVAQENFNRKANRKLFFKESPEVMRKYRVIAGIVVAFLFIFLIFAAVFVAKKITSGKMGSGKYNLRTRIPIKEQLSAWVFMFPAIAFLGIFIYIPLLKGAQMAFYDYHVVADSVFIGLDNFIAMFLDEDFYATLMRTFTYVGLTLGLGFVVPLILALLVSEVPRGSVFFRVVYYLPAITSGVVIMLLWVQFYQPDQHGLFNSLLINAGIIDKGEPLKFLQDADMAMICVILPSIWMHAGPGSLIYQAGLKSIPEELYEAADLDGAGPVYKAFNITVPHLKAILIINFVGAFIGSFQASGNILAMTGGGPSDATMVMGLRVWMDAFTLLKFGAATAMGWIMAVVLISFTLVQINIMQKVEFKSAK
ncbi:MAG: ABC transporter permease subunit, partial [Fibrobacterota bacterium]